MISIGFCVWAYELGRAVDIIVSGLDAAERALGDDEQRVKAELVEIERHIDAGEIDASQLDQYGDFLHDPREIQYYAFETIEETVNEVRKAMIIALYHAWEKIAREVTQASEKADHAKLKEEMAKASITSSPEIDILKSLVNLLKHNNKKRALEVWEKRKDLFEVGYDPDAKLPDDHAASVRIERAHVDEFVKAVLASGPQHPGGLVITS